MEQVTINGETYVRADVLPARNLDGLPYRIVRTQSAGAFAGYLADLTGDTATIAQARRLWYWDGAASLSQLANDGVAKPFTCKFPDPVKTITVLGVIEVLSVTEKARESIASVKPWRV
jgi:hypothetical protein